MLIPASLRNDFEQAMDRYPSDGPRWQRHTVRRGETLIGIAKQYQSSAAAIRKQNGLTNSLIHPGQVLLIAQVDHNAEALTNNPMLPSGAVWERYKVRAGDSLWTISQRFRTTVVALAEANELSATARLHIGQTLAIPGKPTSRRIVYTVRRGDSLARIAARYSVSVAQIARWNDVDPAGILRPGVQLVLHVRATSSWT
jgi:membrane-bound lytic murein transglycosylase D